MRTAITIRVMTIPSYVERKFALISTRKATEIPLVEWVEPSIGHVSSGKDEGKTWCFSGIQYCGIAPRLNGRWFTVRLKPIAGFEAGCWGIGKTVEGFSPNGTRQKPQMSDFHVPGWNSVFPLMIALGEIDRGEQLCQ